MLIHPALDAFPSASDDELREFADDINFFGLKVPIQTRNVAGELDEMTRAVVLRLLRLKLAGRYSRKRPAPSPLQRALKQE